MQYSKTYSAFYISLPSLSPSILTPATPFPSNNQPLPQTPQSTKSEVAFFRLETQYKSAYFSWTPSHVSFPGNEQATISIILPPSIHTRYPRSPAINYYPLLKSFLLNKWQSFCNVPLTVQHTLLTRIQYTATRTNAFPILASLPHPLCHIDTLSESPTLL